MAAEIFGKGGEVGDKYAPRFLKHRLDLISGRLNGDNRKQKQRRSANASK